MYGSAGAFSGYSVQSGARRAVQLWTPAQLSVLARYTADSLVLSNGASVTSLASTGGSGPTLTQMGSSSMPTYITADASFNNLPVMDFSAGTDTCLGTSSQAQSWLNRSDVCFLAVASNGEANRQTLFGTENVSGPQFEIYSSSPETQAIVHPGVFLVMTFYSVATNKFIHVIGADGFPNPTNAVGRQDGSANLSLTTGSGTAFSGSRSVVIGRRGVGSQIYRGKLADLTICPLLPQSDIEKYEGWAAHRYGKTASLPSGHPYKSAPPTV